MGLLEEPHQKKMTFIEVSVSDTTFAIHFSSIANARNIKNRLTTEISAASMGYKSCLYGPDPSVLSYAESRSIDQSPPISPSLIRLPYFSTILLQRTVYLLARLERSKVLDQADRQTVGEEFIQGSSQGVDPSLELKRLGGR